jgi:hypothetical protein
MTHKEAMVGEVMPPLQEVIIPQAFDFERNSNGRYLHTKDNHRGVLITNQITVDYNVIKKAIEIEIPHQTFIADLKDDAAIIEIEDRCIKMGIPHDRVRYNLKLLAREYNPVKEWMESQPWDGKTQAADVPGHHQKPQRGVERDVDEEVAAGLCRCRLRTTWR